MIDRLDEERERALIESAQHADQSAAEKLCHAYTPLIVKLAGRFHTVADLKEELVQAGYEGFMRALKKYRLNERTKLSTYAFPWILGEMRHVMRCAESGHADLSFDMIDLYYSEPSSSEDVALGSGEVRIDLALAFEQMNKEDRLLLYWRYVRDMTQKETASKLMKSQSQISKSEKRILNWLKNQLS